VVHISETPIGLNIKAWQKKRWLFTLPIWSFVTIFSRIIS
jgi:hypothetical protein